MPVAFLFSGPKVHDFGVLRERQFGNGPIDVLFDFFEKSGHSQLGLVTVWRVRFAITRNELHRHPAENVIRDRISVADLWIFGEARGFETLMSKFANQGLE